MITHIVMWTLKSDDIAEKAAHAAELSALLTALPQQIEGITSMAVSTNGVDIPGNWDLVLVSQFVDEAALRAYGPHAAHQAVVSRVREVTSARAAIDFPA